MERADICSRFLDTVAYDLYPFQEEALLSWFEGESGLLVTVPTGMGKTLIAEAAIFEALHTGQRLYYTTPLIALTDQKFREFQEKAEQWGFPRESIGLITGNRRVHPDAPIRVVVAEILLNHLLGGDEVIGDARTVVMDEFHYFNDPERGVVWELSLILLPLNVRLLLLSATVGNPVDFVGWMRKQHGRNLRLIQSNQRRVPLEFEWVSDKLLTEHLPAMLSNDDPDNRAPALVFCFNRDECWEVAERIKGVKLIDQATRTAIEGSLNPDDFALGAGPKLRQMLIRGVAVHHAGVLPKFKEVVETLFLRKLIPFVICTETLAAGVNLPARSVVLSTLLKGKRGDKKLVAPSAAHQMFGRAGRPQFDDKGYVYVLAHEDDVKIDKWRKKCEQIDPNSKDPGLMRARKNLERKRPTRRKTEQYWTEGQFRTLIKAGPARLASRSMISYHVLIYLLHHVASPLDRVTSPLVGGADPSRARKEAKGAPSDVASPLVGGVNGQGSLSKVRDLLRKRFNTPEKLQKFQDQLDHMVENLVTFGYATKVDDPGGLVLHDHVTELLAFRSADALYAAFIAKLLARGNLDEKIQALESILPLSPTLERALRLPEDLPPGPLQTEELEPRLVQMGLATVRPEGGVAAVHEEEWPDYWETDPDAPRALRLPEMMKMLFDAKLAAPENVPVQPKWVAGAIFELGCDFYKFIRARDLAKNEGLVLRHLLRLVILAEEFRSVSGGDPDYERIGELVTRVCQSVDPRYTERFLESQHQAATLTLV